MNILIRQENKTDYTSVFNLIEQAFKTVPFSDHKEHFLVERLRKSTSYIPELSLVATYNETVIGHILLTKIKIINEKTEFNSLALAPVSVLPEYHKKGIGSLLIKKAHEIAKELRHQSIILIGHEDYYPKFGYKQLHTFNIKLPFDVPKENAMAIELVNDSLKNISGTVVYPKEFTEA
ncbi:GCN5 family acetyltransferase [Tenacibaculum holothuriorum]|uniref:GCN5 family acetyltransferase n=1 Tax=Tenacibaculum holothuriorum TaxID=1635173 RepID=A0A1Y2PII9_9FLAO|nr:N-acetyltransferase [Tenacibaculum holothuriorum]OSY89508.1 GCN5 family acetyltransferase [Tenacibaculum holothuriorum]